MPTTEKATKATTPEPTLWDQLAADFPQADLERLPKPLRSRDDNRGTCEDTAQGRRYSSDGHYCGGYHARAVHLDYVGHAGITDRLNKVLGPGGWELRPMALTAEGLPLVSHGVFWAELAIRVGDQSVTKLDVAANFSGPQEMWGDALRRCAMRFGVGTYLWAKSEAALERKRATDEPPEPEPQREQAPPEQQRQPSPAPTTAHGTIVADMIQPLPDALKARIRTWWATADHDGKALPAIAALTPDQASHVVDFITKVQEPEEPGQDPWDSQPAGSWGDQGQNPPA